jgi:hypothetical protein
MQRFLDFSAAHAFSGSILAIDLSPARGFAAPAFGWRVAAERFAG